MQIEDIVLIGFATNNAILFGANHAVENDFKAIVIKDACGANDITSHQTGVSLIESKCTSHIYTKDEFLSHS